MKHLSTLQKIVSVVLLGFILVSFNSCITMTVASMVKQKKEATLAEERRIAQEKAAEERRIAEAKAAEEAAEERKRVRVAGLTELMAAVHKYPEHTSADAYDAFTAMIDMIENGELAYVDETIDGITYKGWVNSSGMPHGIFTIIKNDDKDSYSRFISAYINGKPIFFGLRNYENMCLYGEFDGNGNLNGNGRIFWNSGGKCIGEFKDNFQNGYCISIYPNGVVDRELTGEFSNGKLIHKPLDLAVAEYERNCSRFLDKNMRFVENVDIENNQVYTGNWKDGRPAGYGIRKRSNGGKVGFENGDYKLWLAEKDLSYMEKKTIDGVELHKIIDGYESVTKSISISTEGGKYQYDRKLDGMFCFSGDDYIGNKIYIEKIGYETDACLKIETVDAETLETKSSYSICIDGTRTVVEDGIKCLYLPDGTILVFRVGDSSVIEYTSDGLVYVGGFGGNEQAKRYVRWGAGCLFFDNGEIMQQGYWDNGKFVRQDNTLPEIESKFGDVQKIIGLASIVKSEASKKYRLSPDFRFKF